MNHSRLNSILSFTLKAIDSIFLVLNADCSTSLKRTQKKNSVERKVKEFYSFLLSYVGKQSLLAPEQPRIERLDERFAIVAYINRDERISVVLFSSSAIHLFIK